MNSFSRYREVVQQGIIELQKNIQPPSLQEQINYFLSLGGKRLRPSLVLAGCDLFSGNLNEAIKPALGIELFHNFTLIHDDVMDAAPLRRNKETVHKKWNESTAILAGDAMYATSFSLIASVKNDKLSEVINLFCNTALQVCEGQQLDMLFEKAENVTVDEYLYMIEMKTAVLLACALKLGAIIGGANEKDIHYLYEFGKNIGIAFQLQDDILDVYGEQGKFGKQIGGDIKSGKKTFLLIKALELADETANIIINKIDKNDEDIFKVISIYNNLELKDKAIREMEFYFDNAIKNLERINVEEEKKTALKEFFQAMLVREY